MRACIPLGYMCFLSAAFFVVACNPSVGSDGAGGGATTDGNPCYPDSCNGPSSTGTGGTVCGNTTCTPSEYCADLTGACGKGSYVFSAPPRCAPKPLSCGTTGSGGGGPGGGASLVCGCDGAVHADRCEAEGAGADVSLAENCTPPTGMFSCGGGFCSSKTEYCHKVYFDNQPNIQCFPLPAECTANGATPSCACISGDSRCSDNGGNLTFTDHL